MIPEFRRSLDATSQDQRAHRAVERSCVPRLRDRRVDGHSSTVAEGAASDLVG